MARREPRVGYGGNRWGAALLLAASVAYAPCAATAQIDVSGRWHFTLSDDTFLSVTDRTIQLTQNGSSLTVTPPSAYTAGTIDPLSGALHLDGSGGCVNFVTFEVMTIPWSIDATASADGQTMSGTFAESIQPTRSCFALTGTLQGERLSDLCGNGVVDAGEACDGGLTGSPCCTAFCTPNPAGWPCAADTVCSTSACDGAGACVAFPKTAGTLCRLATGLCDTPEVCDGTATVCPPPSSPTQPDLDGDGVLDPCDDCVGQPLERPMLRLGRFTASPAARDFVKLSAIVHLPPGATLPDPASRGNCSACTGRTPVPVSTCRCRAERGTPRWATDGSRAAIFGCSAASSRPAESCRA
jgi:hypothetical protein